MKFWRHGSNSALRVSSFVRAVLLFEDGAHYVTLLFLTHSLTHPLKISRQIKLLLYYIFMIFILRIHFLANFDMCHCGTSFVPVGCYKDQQNPRLLHNYIMNERDPSITRNYGGQSIDWNNWNEYLPQFICRCSKKAQLLGYDVFGIQHYGKYTD